MRKIIITVIATIFMIASFEKAKGQEQGEIISANIPTVNVLTGVNARLSVDIWRFGLFAQVGQYFQLFEERVETVSQSSWMDEVHNHYREYHWERFFGLRELRFGANFRITDNDYIKLGFSDLRGSSDYSNSVEWTEWFFLGYARKERLTERMTVGLHILYIPDLFISFFHGSSTSQAVRAGLRWNYEIIDNLNLAVQLGYTRGFALRRIYGEIDPILRPLLTRSQIELSVGIHYHIGQRRPADTTERGQRAPRPQQRTFTPPPARHRMLPCPPGQMRHGRSWDRPSSVFNHPAAR